MAAESLTAPDTVRIVCISDTHSRYDFEIPPGEILVHAGDFSRNGLQTEVKTYLETLKSLKNFRLKIIIAGNHDLTLQPEFYEREWKRWHESSKQDAEKICEMMHDTSLAEQYGIIYLEDQEFTDPISGLKFYGSPCQPRFRKEWAFDLPSDSGEIAAVWNRIPSDVDVLITHGPPKGILDLSIRQEHSGCPRLLTRVKEIKPKLHVFGHIHEAYGIEKDDSTIFVNASTCDLQREPKQKPIVVDLPKKNV